MNKSKNRALTMSQHEENENPFEELDRFFARPPVPRDKCPDAISWWGDHVRHHSFMNLNGLTVLYY